jgi:predicted lipoprotein with Yx(FWY)xxD motif
MKRVVPVVVALLALAVVGVVAVSAKSPAKAKKAATVHLRNTKLGRIVVDAKGRTLYLFEKDKRGRSACYGACAGGWPPLLVRGKPTAGAGISKARLGTTRRRGGARQVTLGGHPLYRFVVDKKPGDVKGQDSHAFGADWYVVDGKGRKVRGEG